jgi:UDP-N-acetyl-2-amino-2-deoxyglucuronate dehydrogenase
VKNFALIGAAGFVAPRHMKAIKATGNQLVAAVDPHDAVGAMDEFFPETRFFTEIERFDRHLEKLRRQGDERRVHYVSVCSPNYLHDAHVRLALRLRAHAICEKPLVVNPWNLDQLAELEAEFGVRVRTVLQLRHQPSLLALRDRLAAAPPRGRKHEVVLTYITRRGAWYDVSWKGDPSKSGGLAMNLGVHFFDTLMWLFGRVERAELHLAQPRRMAGFLELERARVSWFLSVEEADLLRSAAAAAARGQKASRTLLVDGEEVDFSSGFADLHTRVYEAILAGGGHGLQDARPSIELISRLRGLEARAASPDARHPLLAD